MMSDVLNGLPELVFMAFPWARSPMFAAGLAVAALGLGIMLWLVARRWSRAAAARGAPKERPPETVTALQRELMDTSEVAMLNLLSLAVRDHFLVLAKMPVARLMRIQVRDDFDAQVVVKTLRALTADFVLLHPGTRRPAKVIFLEQGESHALPWDARQPWVDALFRDADIEVIRLDRDGGYDVERLTDVLGVTDEE